MYKIMDKSDKRWDKFNQRINRLLYNNLSYYIQWLLFYRFESQILSQFLYEYHCSYVYYLSEFMLKIKSPQLKTKKTTPTLRRKLK